MRRKDEFLYLSESDARQAGAGDAARCIGVMEEMARLVAQGDYLMGGPRHNQHGMKLYFPQESSFAGMPSAGADRRFMALAGYLGGRFHVCGAKWYGSNPQNREQGLPRSVHTLVLNEVDTGLPLCIMAGAGVSAARTGGMAGLGAKYLAKKHTRTLALAGIGVIGKACGEAILAACPGIRVVKTFNRTAARAEKLAAEWAQKYGVRVERCADMRQLVEGSDIVSVAVSGSELPEVKAEWLAPGALVLASSDCVVDRACFTTTRLIADNWAMFEDYACEREGQPGGEDADGDLIRILLRLVRGGTVQREAITELGPLVAGTAPGRRSDTEKIFAILGGMCVEDLAWGYTVYQNAVQKGLGTKLSLMGT